MTLIAETPMVVIRQISVSDMDNDVYLLTHKISGEQVLIDAANDIDAIEGLLVQARGDAPQTSLKLVITTHQHSDHVQALAYMAGKAGVITAAGRRDVPGIKAETGVAIDVPLDNDAVIGVEGITLKVIGLRGHTQGSVALAYAENGNPVHLFTGDSLFPGGVGNTNSDPVRFQSLLTDVIARIFDVYDDDAVVHPGHGKPTTLGAERPQLPQWR
ncbi:MAG: MBL fold metallo-hydrolase, partial [Propionibacteriaceae bacterium]|nr:MBL fold metallo-hydrolase [Propionibacteriaceae bacterium]